MKVSFDVKRILFLDMPFKPEMLADEQAVVGVINGEYVFMKRITKEQLKQWEKQAKLECTMDSYELIKQQYDDLKEQLRQMYKLEKKIRDELQKHCPHKNIYKVDDEFLGFDEEPYIELPPLTG